MTPLTLRLEYKITQQWNSKSTGHDPVTLTLTPETDGVLLEIQAPFFNDPSDPGGPQGQAFPELWDYEVVEAFFLSEDEKYLEIELCPHGQHLVLLLDGRRKCIKDKLPLSEWKAEISGATWRGAVHLPAAYFPPGVTRFNAFAIHGSGDQRMYEALYPAPAGVHDQPDFHRLEYFKPIDMKALLPISESASLPDVWQQSRHQIHQ